MSMYYFARLNFKYLYLIYKLLIRISICIYRNTPENIVLQNMKLKTYVIVQKVRLGCFILVRNYVKKIFSTKLIDFKIMSDIY